MTLVSYPLPLCILLISGIVLVDFPWENRRTFCWWCPVSFRTVLGKGRLDVDRFLILEHHLPRNTGTLFRNVSDFMSFEGVGRNFVRWLVYFWEAAAVSNAHACLSIACMFSSFPHFHFLILASQALTPNNHLNPHAKSSSAIRETQARTTPSVAEALSRHLIWPVPFCSRKCI